MNQSRRKFAAILEALGVPPSARRSVATPAAPACESLEGRQLLAGNMGFGMGMPGMGMAQVAGLGTGAAPGFAAQGGSASTAATNPQLAADTTKLQTDMQAIQAQSQVTPAMTSAVTADINAIKAAETTAPNATFVSNLNALTASVNSTPGGPTLGQVFQTEIYQNVVYLSEGVSTALIGQLDADESAVMQATGITAAEEGVLAADHAAITADQAKAMPVAGSTSTTGTTTTTAATATATTPPTGTTTTPTTTASMPGMMPITGAPTAPGSFGGGQNELDAAGASVLLPSASHATTGIAPARGVGTGQWGDLGFYGINPTPTSTSAAETTLLADQATLKTDLTTLQTEQATINKTSNVTPAMQSVVQTYMSAVQGAASTAPSATAVATLKADYTTAMTNSGGPTSAQTAQVQTDKDAVLASEGVNATLISKLDAAQAAVTSASGITAAEQGALYADQTAVTADQAKVKADIAALPPTTTTTTTTTPASATTIAPVDLGFRPMDGGGFMP